MLGLIGKKIGMTQLFDEKGAAIPVTAIQAGPCPIVQVRTDDRDGYRAVQLGFGTKKPRKSGKAANGHAATAGLDYVPAVMREFKLSADDLLADDPHSPAPQAPAPAATDESAVAAEAGEGGEASEPDEAEGPAETETQAVADPKSGMRVGQVLTVAIFEPGERVRVTGRSKGRGFQGVIKRHGFGGFPKTHGHPYRRVGGSIGPGTDPSRVIKGRKMAGRMGGRRRTVRNLSVFKVDPERNLVFIKGSVPGAENGLVFIRKQ